MTRNETDARSATYNSEAENGMDEPAEEIMEETEDGSLIAEAEETDENDLSEQLAVAQEKADDYLDQWRRTAAEFSNYKKRSERERAEHQVFATAGFIGKLLPAIDDLDRAFENLPDHLKEDDWVGGVQMVRQKLMTLLEQEGVEPIAQSGCAFDPNLHEAITYEENSDHEEGEVIDVVQKGYRIGERILRPAQVRVAK